MDYNTAIEHLFSRLPMFSRVGAAAYKPGLQTTEALDEFFGHPHKQFKSIHIAGTNGKGSTSHMVASVLQEAGYKVGLYTSPHLVDFRERIRINGEMISKDWVADFVEQFEALDTDLTPSFFELTMMMAFKYFADQRVDYAVIEVGMGGRLDSTNVISPIITTITNIDFDHTQFLGDTLEKIAGEKAGIIKSGIPAVIGERGEVAHVFQGKGDEVGAEVIFAEDFGEYDPKEWNLPLHGDYQRMNLRTALVTLETLRNRVGVEISDEAIREGLKNVIKNTHLAGRWMQISDSPLVIADTGHNEAGLRYNMPQLMKMLEERRATHPEAKLYLLLGFVSDKAVGDILHLFPQEGEYHITRAQIPRAMPVEQLSSLLEESGIPHRSYANVAEAYDSVLSAAQEHDVIYVGGSTFIVADLLSHLQS